MYKKSEDDVMKKLLDILDIKSVDTSKMRVIYDEFKDDITEYLKECLVYEKKRRSFINGKKKREDELPQKRKKMRFTADFPKFKNRASLDNFIKSERLHQIIMKKKLDTLMKTFNIQPTELCNELETKRELMDFLSRGASGEAYSFNNGGSLSKTVIKIMGLNKISIEEMQKDDETKIWISDKVTQEFLLSSISTKLNVINRCFLKYDGYFFCDSKRKATIQYPNRTKIDGYLVMNKLDGILNNWFRKRVMDFSAVKSILFQIFFAILTMQKEYKMCHRDMHFQNIGFEMLGHKKSLKFIWENKEFTIPNHGILIKVFDYDLGYVGTPVQLTSKTSLGLGKAGIQSKYQPGYDICYVLRNFFKYTERNRNQVNIQMNDFIKSRKLKRNIESVSKALVNIAENQLAMQDLASNLLMRVSATEVIETNTFLRELIRYVYRTADIKYPTQDFLEVDPTGSMKFNDKGLFTSEYQRPKPILSDLDLSGIIFSGSFRDYRKKSKGKNVDIVANVGAIVID